MHRSAPAARLPSGKKEGKPHDRKQPQSESGFRVISPDGDLILVCVLSGHKQGDLKQPECSMRVSSAALSRPGSYFASLLDPGKFQEGRAVRETNLALVSKYGSHEEAMRCAVVDELPRVNIELPPVATKLSRVALVETFFRMVVFSGGSTTASGNEDRDEGDSLHRLADLPIPFLASLAVISDRFGVVPLFRAALGYAHIPSKEGPGAGLSRLLHRLRTYESENEGRIRQAIHLSWILEDTLAVRCTTQGLIIRGSREWSLDSGAHVAGIDRAIWWYLPMGIEEELAFRHQCILNTIADLQNHFLRAYGAFPAAPGQQSHDSPRRLQCTRAYANSHACDCFHLGEIIRFFSSRTKTMVIESSIADPDLFSDDEDNNEQPSTEPNSHIRPPPPAGPNLTLPQPSTSVSASTSITALISSLRQCPEYQIDPNHAGCGMRRRLIPALDFVENFTNSQSHVLGICVRHWRGDARSWRDKRLARPLEVCVSKSGFIEAAQWTKGKGLCDCISNMEDARAIFSARERRWNL